MGFGEQKANQIGLEDLNGMYFTNHILFTHFDLFLEKQPLLEVELQEIERRDKISITRLGNEEGIICDLEKKQMVLIQ